MEFKEQQTNRRKVSQKKHLENKNPKSDNCEPEHEETEISTQQKLRKRRNPRTLPHKYEGLYLQIRYSRVSE